MMQKLQMSTSERPGVAACLCCALCSALFLASVQSYAQAVQTVPTPAGVRSPNQELGNKAGEADLQQKYAQQWGAREGEARNAAQYALLAGELLEAAQQPGVEADWAVFLCRRAYELGSRFRYDGQTSRTGYATAARALDHLQRISPDHRLEALTSLKQLYQNAYESNPNKMLGMGVGLADVILRVANQRMAEIEQQRKAGQSTAADRVAQLAKVIEEYNTAGETLDAVLTRAERLAQFMRERSPDAAREIENFVKSNQSLVEDVKRSLAATEPIYERMQTVSRDEESYRQVPNRLLAERLGQIYLVELDSPHDALRFAPHYLSQKDQAILALATRQPDELDPEDSLRVGSWYLTLAQVAGAMHKPRMLLNAGRFFARCDEAFEATDSRFAAASRGFQTANEELRKLDRLPLALELRARPAIVVEPAEEQPQVAINEAAKPVEEKVAQAEEKVEPKKDTQTAATDSNRVYKSDGTWVDNNGRHWAQCQQCFSTYSPQDGESTTKCPRCSKGGGSIFDF